MNTPTLPIRERLALREPVKLDSETMASALAYFRANPDATAVYVCYGGACISVADMLGKCKTRTGQLVSIATIGIPMYVSRKHKHVAAELARPAFSSHLAESLFATGAAQLRAMGAQLGERGAT